MKKFTLDFLDDQRAIWRSPFHPSRHTLLTRMLPLAAGTALLIAYDTKMSNGLPNTPDQIRVSNAISYAGAAYTLSAVVAAPIIAGSINRKSAPVEIGRGAALALADSIVVNVAMKYTFLRVRPDASNGAGPFFSGGDGFPSGHAMLSWAACTALAQNRRSPKWLKITSYTAATVISLARITARRHFPSDVFVGGVLGYWIGSYSIVVPR